MQKEPENCPGTSNTEAGKASACAGCPNQTICATSKPVVDPDIAIIAAKLRHVKHKILILSGKGGVGKSTFSTTLSYALSVESRVALIDIDICGPSIPRMTATENESVHMSNSGWEPVSVSDNLTVMSVAFMLPNADDAIIWRGSKKNGLIKQFLKDVDWQGDDSEYAPEFLIFDTPPGTSDEHLSLVQFLKDAGITGAVVITTPQEVALQDVRKEINFCRKVKLPIIGVVENMARFTCGHCKKESYIFKPDTGGAAQMCIDMDVKMLGSIPIDPRIAQCCDSGVSYLDEFPSSPATLAYTEIISKIRASLSSE